MLKLYNKTHKEDIGSYTKKFWEFYDHIYEDQLNRKINAEKRRQKELMKDPKKSRQKKAEHKTSEMRFKTLLKKLNNKAYTYDAIEVRGKMEYLEDDEIIADIKEQQSSEIGDIGSYEVDWDTIDKHEFTQMAQHYEQKSHDDYLYYLQQQSES